LPAENSRRDAVTHQQAVETLATERYLLNDMSGADRDAFEEHFFSCELCADDLRVSAAMVKGARSGFAATATAGRVLPMVSPAARKPAWYRSAALPWAAAAALAAMTTYQSVRIVPSQPRDEAAMAIVPVSLRPASRGAEPVVPLPSDGAPITLAIEINEPAENGQLIYSLANADGRPIVSGRAAAPAPGTPLLLLIPSTLAGPSHYILSVHDAGPSNRTLGEYRFAVSAQ
jgi:hypothetical protein